MGERLWGLEQLRFFSLCSSPLPPHHPFFLFILALPWSLEGACVLCLGLDKR